MTPEPLRRFPWERNFCFLTISMDLVDIVLCVVGGRDTQCRRSRLATLARHAPRYTEYHPVRPTRRDPLSIARGLAGDPRLPVRPVSTERRSWELLAATDEYEAWVIDWPRSEGVSFHDHGDSSGAVVVVSGELVETRVIRGSDGRLDVVRTRLRAGGTLVVSPGVVHDVVNDGIRSATSIHVYSPRLTSMTYFRFEEDDLVPDHSVSYVSGH
jgi:mannose-6-phosphate isomerase-like protein (cupin superfamily)